VARFVGDHIHHQRGYVAHSVSLPLFVRDGAFVFVLLGGLNSALFPEAASGRLPRGLRDHREAEDEDREEREDQDVALLAGALFGEI
jgi:hypothetical protein